MFSDEQIKKLSTQRLLKIFRSVRKSIFCREPERTSSDESYNEEYDLHDKLKAELATREHVPKKRKR